MYRPFCDGVEGGGIHGKQNRFNHGKRLGLQEYSTYNQGEEPPGRYLEYIKDFGTKFGKG